MPFPSAEAVLTLLLALHAVVTCAAETEPRQPADPGPRLAETIGRSDPSSPIEVNAPGCGAPSPRLLAAIQEPVTVAAAAEPALPPPRPPLRIVGGRPAPAGAFPWLVGVANFFGSIPFCGGAIINERFVLTAAHCLMSRYPITLSVLVNKQLRKKDANQIKFSIKRIIRHPDFSRKTLNADLALLELKESLRELILARTVWPICLPTAPCGGGSNSDACFLGRKVILAGWGSLKRGGPKPVELQYTSVNILPNGPCAESYIREDIRVNDNMICAGLEAGGRDTCQGDSGGPMMLERSDGAFTLAGVVSFGLFCASPDFPGVYVRVTEFIDWITQESQL
ncbi:trypsin-1-like [Pollicipes pollicipes]|uniref:trypsin-1-like n=1 Tax=Pollicipes pollicipes TaxID=41117 RepID=UPI001884FEB2|nr:trypsin-1-like [Pollicipes pollicipes]